MSLNARAWLSLAILPIMMGLLVFVPAGTIHYWQGWVYLSVFMGASVLTTLDLMRRDPALLERRMKGGPTAESEPTQKVIMLIASVGFIALLVVPALDHRLNVGQGQSVISTGPYAIVRHPMYASASLYLLGTPLALGSYWGISAMLVMMPALIWRLIDEERMLARSLPGYTDYQRRVRHRLVPFVW